MSSFLTSASVSSLGEMDIFLSCGVCALTSFFSFVMVRSLYIPQLWLDCGYKQCFYTVYS